MSLRFIPKSPFWKNVFTLALGTSLAQLIPVLISPVLTHLYTPEQFGIYGLYFSLTMVLSVIICGRYEMAILLPENDEERINLLALCVVIAVFVSTFLLIVLYFWDGWFATILKNESIKSELVFLPISVFIIGVFQSMNYWANIKKQYPQLSVSRVSRSLTTSVSSIFFGFSIFKKSGLIFADLIGQLVACFYLFHKIWKQTIEFHKFISIKGIINTATRYKNFPQFNLVSGLFEKASSHAPIFLLTVLFSSADAGFFALALRFISAPVSLVSISIGDVFRQEAAEFYMKNGNCHDIFMNTFKKLIIIAIPVFIIIFIVIKLLFIPIFGEKWEQAADYSEIMCVMFFLQFTLSPLSSMFIIAEKQNIDMRANIILFVMCISVFYLAKVYFNSSLLAIFFYSILYCLKYIVQFLFSLKYSKGNNLFGKL